MQPYPDNASGGGTNFEYLPVAAAPPGIPLATAEYPGLAVASISR